MSKYTGTTVLAKIWTHYANPKLERMYSKTLRLEKEKEIQEIAEITFP